MLSKHELHLHQQMPVCRLGTDDMELYVRFQARMGRSPAKTSKLNKRFVTCQSSPKTRGTPQAFIMFVRSGGFSVEGLGQRAPALERSHHEAAGPASQYA